MHCVSNPAYRRRLCVDAKALGVQSTDLQHTKVLERRNRLQRKIDAWCNVQLLYMPAVAALRAKDADNTVASVVTAENMDLLMPSQVLGRISCDVSLAEYEWRLRYAQAHDALHDI